MKQLLLCRHAKSSWKDLQVVDIDRPLNKRGKRDAAVMGQRLAQQGIKLDALVTSTAKRARKTAYFLANALHYPAKEIIFNERIYDATPEELLTCIRTLDNSLEHVLLVGHNPGFTILVNLLGNMRIPNLPTCGIVSFLFAVDNWREVEAGKGEAQFIDYPKNIGQ